MATASFSSTFSLTVVVSYLLQAFASAERIFIIEDTKVETPEKKECVSCGEINTITLQDVSFTYPKTDIEILKDVTIHFHKGEKIGIVGESGAGKSTLFRLLLRFYDPTSGKLTINGIDEKDISYAEIHKHIAMLEQDTYLFDCSIADNIALAKPGCSMEEIRLAARRAGIADRIETLPDKYDTQMGQMSGRLSGGEKQRIGIARIMLLDPDVIVMDEPTSVLDVLHEEELLKTLFTEYKDKLIIIISHRESTIKGCDRILRLDNGTFVEEN